MAVPMSASRRPCFHAIRESRSSGMVTVQSSVTESWQARRTPPADSLSFSFPFPDSGGGIDHDPALATAPLAAAGVIEEDPGML